MESNRAKAAVAIGSLALIVILFVVLSGGDEESTTGGDEVAATTTADGPEEGSGDEHADGKEHADGEHANGEKPAGGEAAERGPVIDVRGGEPVGGVAELEFEKGGEIRFAVRSDVVEEVHVHGYDVYGDLEPGETTDFAFPAEIDGVFEVELHGTGAVLAELTVKP